MNAEMTLKVAPPPETVELPWVKVTDFDADQGWTGESRGAERARWCCEQLEEGRVLWFPELPYHFPDADQRFLLEQRQQDARLHKNISYRPKQDVLRGSAGQNPAETQKLHGIMRNFSAEVTRFLGKVLTPYASRWSLDFASFRPEEEQGRKLPLHKRNDLLHCDSFPTRPMRGNRILRCFTNINPTEPRVWLTTDGFGSLARQFAHEAGLDSFANPAAFTSWGYGLARVFGLKSGKRSAYDRFMLRFHDYLKENSAFQDQCRKF